MIDTTARADAAASAPSTPAPAVRAASAADAHSAGRMAARFFGVAVVGGVAVSTLAVGRGAGLGLTLAVWAALATWVACARVRRRAMTRIEVAVVAALALLGTMPSLRASTWVHAEALAASVVLVALLPWAARARTASLTLARAQKAALTTVGGAVTGALASARHELDAASLSARLRAPLLGLIVSLPVAAVFLALFASADEVFASLVSRAVAIDGTVVGKLVVAAAVAWTLAGVAYVTNTPRGAARAADGTTFGRARPAKLPLGAGELVWVVLVVDAVFALFVAMQLVHMIGFADALATPGVTYSAAARAGFFQLLFVVLLASAVVLVTSWSLRGVDGAAARVTRHALGVLVGLTSVVGASALWRMAAYTEAYGLTEPRLHASALMIVLLAALAWLAMTVLRGARRRFLPGALATGVVGVLVLAAANPDAVIARVNAERGVGVDHLPSLSADATAAMAALSTDDALPPATRAWLRTLVAQRVSALRDRPILSWSLPLARTAAIELQ